MLTQEFDRRHLTLVSFGIREVHLPQALQRSLDQKIQAQQAAEQQTYQLEQAKPPIVSVSRRAGPPHMGQVVLTNSGIVANGDSPVPDDS